RPVARAMTDWNTWIAKFARYWSSLSAPIRKKTPNRRTGRSGSRAGAAIGAPGRLVTSAANRAIVPDGEPPDDAHADRPDRDTECLHRQAAQQFRDRQPPDERLDGEAEGPLERQHVGETLGPVGHEGQRHEPA